MSGIQKKIKDRVASIGIKHGLDMADDLIREFVSEENRDVAHILGHIVQGLREVADKKHIKGELTASKNSIVKVEERPSEVKDAKQQEVL